MSPETVRSDPTINVAHPWREDHAGATAAPMVWFDRYHSDENAGWVYRDVEGLDTALNASDPGNPTRPWPRSPSAGGRADRPGRCRPTNR